MDARTTHETMLTQTQYDRQACDIGIVHLGFGAFHRAHQAVYIDDYMEATGDLRWGIAAVNLRASEAPAFKNVQQAEEGFALKTTSPQGDKTYRLVRSHVAFVDWTSEAEAAENLLSFPSVHAVTITVTESGYYLNDDWSLNTQDPLIADEIKGGKGQSVYAFLASALEKRMQANLGPLSILCCDNIRSNGRMLASNFTAYLAATKRNELAEWAKLNLSFPCSMVDRITPRATETLTSEITSLFPGKTLAPIHAESFTQWVIADNFAGPMPDLAKVGVQVVDDVDAYEEAKIRILNGGHTGLAYLGALAGLSTFDEAMHHKELRKHFDRWEQEEVLPGLNMPLPLDKQAYLGEIADRFENAAIADNLERICMDGYSKIPIYVRPTLRSCLEQGIHPAAGFDCVASWVVYARRFADGVMPITYHEPYWDELAPLIRVGQEETLARETKIWGELPEQFESFVPSLIDAIQRMEEKWPA